MLTVSINTTRTHCAYVLFTLYPFAERVDTMLRVTLLVCFISTTFGIIVRDHPSPKDYKYSYNIDDPATGDRKSQSEERQGDVVTGAYSVIAPDGTNRIVQYIADPMQGFKALVSEEPSSNILVRQPNLFNPFFASEVKAYIPIQRAASMTRSLFTSAIPSMPRTNYLHKKPVLYFTPQSQLEYRMQLPNGQYFLPAYNHY